MAQRAIRENRGLPWLRTPAKPKNKKNVVPVTYPNSTPLIPVLPYQSMTIENPVIEDSQNQTHLALFLTQKDQILKNEKKKKKISQMEEDLIAMRQDLLEDAQKEKLDTMEKDLVDLRWSYNIKKNEFIQKYGMYP